MMTPHHKKIQHTAIFFVLMFATMSGLSYAERGIRPVNPSRGERIALIIGNSDYRSSPLKNPANDARGMARVLKESGFDVTVVLNAGQREMENAIRDFGKKLRRGGAGLFYYAGHGIQLRGRNYLIRYIKSPGLTIEQVLKRVRVAVVAETANRQIPWESSSLIGNFYFQPGDENVPVGTSSSGSIHRLDAEEEMWLLVKESEDIKDIEAFLSAYPHGRFARLPR